MIWVVTLLSGTRPVLISNRQKQLRLTSDQSSTYMRSQESSLLVATFSAQRRSACVLSGLGPLALNVLALPAFTGFNI